LILSNLTVNYLKNEEDYFIEFEVVSVLHYFLGKYYCNK